jgi:hypothetical protein
MGSYDGPANDLVLIGRDDRGFNHYFDARRERVAVVDVKKRSQAEGHPRVIVR